VTPEQIDSKQSLLASIVTDDAASAMFDALKRKHAKKPDALAKAIDELLTAHDIDPNAEPPASRASGAGERPNAEPPAEPPPPAAETTHEPTPQPAHASGAQLHVTRPRQREQMRHRRLASASPGSRAAGRRALHRANTVRFGPRRGV